MHGYGRNTDLLAIPDKHLYGSVASVTGTNYCPDYYPPP